MSLMTLLLSSASSVAEPARLPALPDQPKRTRAIYAPPPWPRSAGALAFLGWVWSYFLLAWNTMVDVAFFVATIMFLRDPDTMFKHSDDTVFNPRRRFVHRSLSLDDVKFIKNAINCTVNDVLVGATSAALSRYYFRKSGNTNTKKICLRSVIPVNLRPTHSLQTDVNMIESGKSKDVAWGNQLGYIILPFHLAMHDDPLAYVRKAKRTLDREKSSLEVVFTSEQTKLCGHPVVFIAPTVYGVPQALIVHYQSYCSSIKVILSVDEDIFPDYSELLDDFADSFRHIKDAASKL